MQSYENEYRNILFIMIANLIFYHEIDAYWK